MSVAYPRHWCSMPCKNMMCVRYKQLLAVAFSFCLRIMFTLTERMFLVLPFHAFRVTEY